MFKKTCWTVASLSLIASTLLAACAQPTPEVVQVEVEVTRVVEVEGEGETETVVETETIVVTATPEPEEPVEFKSAVPDTLYYIAGAGEQQSLDPALNYENAGGEIMLNVYDQLVTYDGTSAISFVPALAESWEISDDGLTYVFHIRQGVKFHSGADLTSEDVGYTFQRGLLQGGYASPQALLTEPLFGTGVYDIAELIDPALADDPEGLQAADPDALMAACQTVMDAVVVDEGNWTVTFNLAQPWAPLLATLAGAWGSIIDKDWAIENGTWDGDCSAWQNYYGVTAETAPLRDIMNGTGPYMFDHWTPNEETVLVKNPNYWREEQGVPAFEGAPTSGSIDRVVIRLVNEWGTRFAMLQAGDADFIYVPRQNAPQVDPLVGEWCEWNAATQVFDCAPTETPDAPVRLFRGYPLTTRADAYFTFDVNDEGGNPFLGSGELDGNGIPPDFFSDVHVRKAFNYCFDWEAYIHDALEGEAVQSIGFMLPGMIGYDPGGPHYSFDLDKCAEELQLAWDGQTWEQGFRLQIGYNTGNVTRQTIIQILQDNFSTVDPKFQIESIGLPWPSFLNATQNSRLPIFVSGWGEDFHDPHNWAQPLLAGYYGYKQLMPETMRQEFAELVSAGVSATSDEERAMVYKELAQLEYEYAPAIRLAVATGRHYEPRWMSGWYYNPIYDTFSHYYTYTKE